MKPLRKSRTIWAATLGALPACWNLLIEGVLPALVTLPADVTASGLVLPPKLVSVIGVLAGVAVLVLRVADKWAQKGAK